MNRSILWLVGLVVIAGGVVAFSLSPYAPWHKPDGGPPNNNGQPKDGSQGLIPGRSGRYEAVQSNDREVILLDTTNGDLYRAATSDLKPKPAPTEPPTTP
jgi:hypothetical protein